MTTPFTETALGKFLTSKGFDSVLSLVGTAVPGVAILHKVKDAVLGSPQYASMSPEDKTLFLQLHQMELDAAVAEDKNQTDVNIVEAQSKNMFIAGWRPFVGWVCAGGLAMQFLVNPLFTWIAALCHWVDYSGKAVTFPMLDMGTLVTLLVGMLGMGAMRMNEKLNNVAAT